MCRRHRNGTGSYGRYVLSTNRIVAAPLFCKSNDSWHLVLQSCLGKLARSNFFLRSSSRALSPAEAAATECSAGAVEAAESLRSWPWPVHGDRGRAQVQPMEKAPAGPKWAPPGGGVLGAAAGTSRTLGISVTLVHGATREGKLSNLIEHHVPTPAPSPPRVPFWGTTEIERDLQLHRVSVKLLNLPHGTSKCEYMKGAEPLGTIPRHPGAPCNSP